MPFYLELFARLDEVKLSIDDEHKVKKHYCKKKNKISIKTTGKLSLPSPHFNHGTMV